MGKMRKKTTLEYNLSYCDICYTLMLIPKQCLNIINIVISKIKMEAIDCFILKRILMHWSLFYLGAIILLLSLETNQNK